MLREKSECMGSVYEKSEGLSFIPIMRMAAFWFNNKAGKDGTRRPRIVHTLERRESVRLDETENRVSFIGRTMGPNVCTAEAD